MHWRKLLIFSLVVLFFFTVSITIFSIVLTSMAARAIVAGDTAAAGRYTAIAAPIASSIDFVTFRRSQTIRCWVTGLELAKQLPAYQDALDAIGGEYQLTGRIQLSQLPTLLTTTKNNVTVLRNCIETNKLIARSIPAEKRSHAIKQVATLETVLVALEPLFSADQTWVVMFQNTTELRPTGGFTGSYALLELHNQVIQNVIIEDIYDADGQVQHFKAAPPGIREYTSGNNGLRLPDANWWPDFPTSAQTQLDFLAEAGKNNLRGLMAVNLTLLQDLVHITGPIDLPDYQTSLTPENAPILLRSHADDFFPGSKEKKQLLAYAIRQLQYRLAEMPIAQQKQVGALLLRAAAVKDIQIYSTDPVQQQHLNQLGVAAALDSSDYPILALVEANVGINKSNQFIKRSVAITQDGSELQVALQLTNTANPLLSSLSASLSGYVNYQRIVTSPALKVASITTNKLNEPTSTTNWSTDAGTVFNEHGFLQTILPGQTQTVTYNLTRLDAASPILFWHQSGTGSTPITLVKTNGEAKTFSVDHDLVITP